MMMLLFCLKALPFDFGLLEAIDSGAAKDPGPWLGELRPGHFQVPEDQIEQVRCDLLAAGRQ